MVIMIIFSIVFYILALAAFPAMFIGLIGIGIAVLKKDTFGASVKLADASTTRDNTFKAKTIKEISDGFRHRLQNVQFNNTTELNSTIYFCRANHQEFNYSTNPTYTNASSK